MIFDRGANADGSARALGRLGMLGIAQPIDSEVQPCVIPFLMPIRSITRPIGTAKIIGNKASNAINTPMVNSDAGNDNPYSEAAIHAPIGATRAASEAVMS